MVDSQRRTQISYVQKTNVFLQLQLMEVDETDVPDNEEFAQMLLDLDNPDVQPELFKVRYLL